MNAQREKTFREVGGLMWLAGISSSECYERALTLSRLALANAVLAGFRECAQRYERAAPVDEWWVKK